MNTNTWCSYCESFGNHAWNSHVPALMSNRRQPFDPSSAKPQKVALADGSEAIRAPLREVFIPEQE